MASFQNAKIIKSSSKFLNFNKKFLFKICEKHFLSSFQLRGVIRTLNPREEKYMQAEIKFKRQVFLRNVMRLKAIIVWFIDLSKYLS